MATATQIQGTHNWNIDPTHSSIDFSVKHMGLFTVRGTLGSVTGSGQTVDSKLTSANLSIDISQINTNNEQRDEHLKGADFLDIAAHPAMTFTSTSMVAKSETEYTITGELSIKGQSHPVTVEAEIVYPVTDPWGMLRSGATGSGVIKRSEWGITYNSVLETGHVMVSDDVKFTFDIQAVLSQS